MKKPIILLSIVTALSVYAVTAFKNKEFGNPEAKTFNYKFNVTNLKGNTVSFTDFKEKVVFLNLWATWCGPCRYEMPGIQNLYSSIGSDTIVFVMLSLDRPADLHKVIAYSKNNNFTFPVFMPTGSLPDQLNVPTIPTTFIIDKNGKIVVHHVGATNYDTEHYRNLLTELATSK
jgi:thiol-disulfide isomerase/thioredoxin